MIYEVTLNNKVFTVDVTEAEAAVTNIGTAAPAPVQAAPAQAPAQSVGAGEQVKSPMPGNILAVNVTPGATVNAGDVMFVLEAMKMENEIVAPVSGTVKQVLVAKGSVVNTDEVLAVI